MISTQYYDGSFHSVCLLVSSVLIGSILGLKAIQVLDPGHLSSFMHGLPLLVWVSG